jgi:plastocyanin
MRAAGSIPRPFEPPLRARATAAFGPLSWRVAVSRRAPQVVALVALASFAALVGVLPSSGAGREVRMRDRRFVPEEVRVPVGGAVTFVNESPLTHTASCPACARDTGDILPGTLRTVVFPHAGTFELVCRYHGAQGMRARLVVG